MLKQVCNALNDFYVNILGSDNQQLEIPSVIIIVVKTLLVTSQIIQVLDMLNVALSGDI